MLARIRFVQSAFLTGFNHLQTGPIRHLWFVLGTLFNIGIAVFFWQLFGLAWAAVMGVIGIGVVTFDGAYIEWQRASGGADDLQRRMNSLPEETRAMLPTIGRQLRQYGYVTGNSSDRPHYERLRLAGFLTVTREDAGWWSQERHKGMNDIYRLSSSGSDALDRIESQSHAGATTSRVKQIADLLRGQVGCKGRNQKMADLLLLHADAFSGGLRAGETRVDTQQEAQRFIGEMSQQGLIRAEIAQGVQQSVTVHYLTDLGAEVVRHLKRP